LPFSKEFGFYFLDKTYGLSLNKVRRFFLLAIRSAVSHYGNRLTVMQICEYLNFGAPGKSAESSE
jgi:hypothetical protein